MSPTHRLRGGGVNPSGFLFPLQATSAASGTKRRCTDVKSVHVLPRYFLPRRTYEFCILSLAFTLSSLSPLPHAQLIESVGKATETPRRDQVLRRRRVSDICCGWMCLSLTELLSTWCRFILPSSLTTFTPPFQHNRLAAPAETVASAEAAEEGGEEPVDEPASEPVVAAPVEEEVESVEEEPTVTAVEEDIANTDADAGAGEWIADDWRLAAGLAPRKCGFPTSPPNWRENCGC